VADLGQVARTRIFSQEDQKIRSCEFGGSPRLRRAKKCIKLTGGSANPKIFARPSALLIFL
jgi:hypothetical protein